MTERWKPGDVAWLVAANGVEGIVLRFDAGHECRWADKNGPLSSDGVWIETVRPLVAIDPEDREQCRDLADRIAPNMSGNTNATQAALRDVVAQRLPEPQGAAALVEDNAGDWWARLSRGADGAVWHRIGVPEARANWRDIAVARVLSEGVTS